MFAAIQFEVSLSSSHFLIHFLSHCTRQKSYHFDWETIGNSLYCIVGKCWSDWFVTWIAYLTLNRVMPILSTVEAAHGRRIQSSELIYFQSFPIIHTWHKSFVIENEAALTRTDGHTCTSLVWHQDIGPWQHDDSPVLDTTLTIGCT